MPTSSSSNLCLFIVLVAVCVSAIDARSKRQAGFSFPTRGRAAETCTLRGRRGSGVCRPLPDCPSVAAVISSSPRQNYARRLRESLCHYDRSTPVVCCPQDGAQPETLRPKVEKERQVGPGPGAGVSCGTTEDVIDTRILNGRKAALNAWPWAAAIYDEQFNRVFFRCGGTLINANYILTAAHCVADRFGIIPANKFTVRLGLINLSAGTAGSRPLQLSVSRVIVHPKYDVRRAQPELDDIALLRLSSPVTFHSGLKPICLPSASLARQTFIGTMPFIIGWGKTETGKYSDDLMEVQIPVQDLNQCKTVYPSIPIGSTHLCAGYPRGGKDSCQGDSGGPMMLQDPSNTSPSSPWNIIGIVSMGPECGKAGLPAIYTKVTSYLDWIQTNAV